MSTQQASKNVVVLIDSTETPVKGIQWGVRVSDVEDHDLSGGDPIILDVVERSYWFSWTKGWLDNTLAAKILAGTSFSLEIRPAGTGAGKAKSVYGTCYLTEYEDRAEKNAVVLMNVRGKAKTRADGTQ